MTAFELVLPAGAVVHDRGVISTSLEAWYEAELAELAPVDVALLGHFAADGWPYVAARVHTRTETLWVAFYRADEHGFAAVIRGEQEAALGAFANARMILHPQLVSIAQVWSNLEVS